MEDIKKLNKLIFIILILILILTSVNVKSQNLVETLSQPISNCETVATNSQQVIVNLGIENIDSIYQILEYWERTCGNVEPIQRLKILLDIKRNVIDDDFNSSYIEFYLKRYKYRVSDSKRINYFDYYESAKSYYNYVSLNGPFDEWIKSISRELSKHQIEGTSSYLFCLLFSQDVSSFDLALESKLYQDSPVRNAIRTEKHYSHINFWSLMIGGKKPLGKMNEFFGLSPQIGITVGIPILEVNRVDLKVIVSPQLDKQILDYNIDDELVSTEYESTATVGVLFTREINFNNNLFWNFNGGINIGILNTGIEKDLDDDKTKSFNINTVDLEIGTNVRTVFFKNRTVGLYGALHFSPYNWDKRLITDIGSFYLDFGIIVGL